MVMLVMVMLVMVVLVMVMLVMVSIGVDDILMTNTRTLVMM